MAASENQAVPIDRQFDSRDEQNMGGLLVRLLLRIWRVRRLGDLAWRPADCVGYIGRIADVYINELLARHLVQIYEYDGQADLVLTELGANVATDLALSIGVQPDVISQCTAPAPAATLGTPVAINEEPGGCGNAPPEPPNLPAVTASA